MIFVGMEKIDLYRRNPLVICEDDCNNATIDGEEYYLLCELNSRDGKNSEKIYAQKTGCGVIAASEKIAIVGLFSIRKSEIKKLFDYIEAMTDKTLTCYEANSFPQLLQTAIAAGGKYPNIARNLRNKKSFGSKRLFTFGRKNRNSNAEAAICGHTVPVEYTKKEERAEECSFSGCFSSEEDFNEPTLTPSKILPNGWNWKEWKDGSGILEGPNFEHYFAFDRTPYHRENGIEYRINVDDSFSVFYGTTEEFKGYAEAFVLAMLPLKK